GRRQDGERPADRGRRRRRGRRCPRERRLGAPRIGGPRRGARRPAEHRQPDERRNPDRGEDPVRVVIADDSVLFREGLARVLAEGDFEVAAQAGDADELREAVRREQPDLVVVAVRLPPTQTDEGTRFARELRAERPEVAVLVLSQTIEVRHAFELFSEHPEGFGYLLKDRVLDVEEFYDSLRRVARGGTVVDPQVVGQLIG